MKKIFTTLFASILATFVFAQTNFQIQYDFGRGAKYSPWATATLEGSYFDNWGSTYFFTDFDICSYNPGAYTEFSRSINFWQNSFLKNFSIQIEVDGGFYKSLFVNPAILAGVNYTFQSENLQNFFQVQILYKKIFDGEIFVNTGTAIEQFVLAGVSKIPLQFTLVWGCNDIFKVKGLSFLGFADFYWQEQELTCGKTSIVFMTEPQIWYSIGQWFNCSALNIGGEIEVSANFDADVKEHITCYPSLGIKYVF